MTARNAMLSLVLALLGTTAVSAQQAATEAMTTTPPAGLATRGSLEEVIVTANRRAQTLTEVAASVTRLVPYDEIGLLDLTHYEEALNRVPGVMVQRGSGQESLVALRSPVLSGSGACGAFLILEDGFAIRPRGFCNINQMFEINTRQAAAIEVLRGPGTSSHGAHALHGVINVIQPSAAQLEGLRLTLTTGAYEHGVAGFAFGNGTSAVQGFWRHDGSFRDDATVKDGHLSLLHDARWREGALQWRLHHSELDQDTAGFIQGFESYRDPVTRRSNPNPEAFRKAQSTRASAQWSRSDCTDCELEWRGILRHSSMEFRQHFLLGKPMEENAQVSAAFSLSQTRPLEMLAGLRLQYGLDAEWAQGELLQFQEQATAEGSAVARGIRPAGRHYDYRVNISGLGLLANIEYPHGSWLWRAGVRVDHTRFDYHNRLPSGNTAEDGSACGFGGCLYLRPADRRDEFTDITPRLEILRPLGVDGSSGAIYLLLSDAFRPPEVTELYRLQRGQSVEGIDSERMSGAELGWRFTSGALRGSLALFEQRKRDLILRDSNGLSVTGGKSSHEGLEYELAWQFNPSMKLRAAGSFARHRYEFDRLIAGGERIIAGNDIDTAPRDLHGLEFSWRIGPGLLALEARHVGRYFADAENQQAYPGHTLLGLQWRQRFKENMSLAVQIENLADRDYADRADFAFGNWRYFPGRGRSAYVSLDWRVN